MLAWCFCCGVDNGGGGSDWDGLLEGLLIAVGWWLYYVSCRVLSWQINRLMLK